MTYACKEMVSTECLFNVECCRKLYYFKAVKAYIIATTPDFLFITLGRHSAILS
jgi:hypothetical protein